MSSFNKVILIGRLTGKDELRYTPDGKPVLGFTIMVTEHRGGGPEKETEFACVAWQQAAEFTSREVTEGRLICIEGRLQFRSWEDQETGQKRKTPEIICNEVRLLGDGRIGYNKAFLIGRTTRDPELKYTPNGKPVAKFTVAIDRNRGRQGQDKETDFIDCSIWQQSAEFASKYATKGRLVHVEGRVDIRSWEDQNGQRRIGAEVVCNDLRLLDRRDSAGGGGHESGGGGYGYGSSSSYGSGGSSSGYGSGSGYGRGGQGNGASERETVYSSGSQSSDKGGGFSHGGSQDFDDDIPF